MDSDSERNPRGTGPMKRPCAQPNERRMLLLSRDQAESNLRHCPTVLAWSVLPQKWLKSGANEEAMTMESQPDTVPEK